MNIFFYFSFLWLQVADVTGSPVSLTVVEGGSLTGPHCPGTIPLLCEGLELIFQRWRFNDANNIHTFDIGDSPTTIPPSNTNHPAFLSVTLNGISQGADPLRANFSSTLTVDVGQLQNVMNITCGDLRTDIISVNVTLLQPTIPTTPNITNITADYQSTGLSSVGVTWRKLEMTCPQFEASLQYEVSAGSGLSQNISQSSCGESFCTAQFNTSPGAVISLRAFNDIGTSGTATYTIEQDSGQYFTAQVNIDNCEATTRCVAGGSLTEDASCSLDYMGLSDPRVYPLNETFAIQRLQPNTEYLFVFSVMVDKRLTVTVTLENSTGTCEAMMSGSGLGSGAIAGIIVVVVGVPVPAIIMVVIVLVIIIINKKRRSKTVKMKQLLVSTTGTEMLERHQSDSGSETGSETTVDQPTKCVKVEGMQAAIADAIEDSEERRRRNSQQNVPQDVDDEADNPDSVDPPPPQDSVDPPLQNQQANTTLLQVNQQGACGPCRSALSQNEVDYMQGSQERAEVSTGPTKAGSGTHEVKELEQKPKEVSMQDLISVLTDWRKDFDEQRKRDLEQKNDQLRQVTLERDQIQSLLDKKTKELERVKSETKQQLAEMKEELKKQMDEELQKKDLEIQILKKEISDLSAEKEKLQKQLEKIQDEMNTMNKNMADFQKHNQHTEKEMKTKLAELSSQVNQLSHNRAVVSVETYTSAPLVPVDAKILDREYRPLCETSSVSTPPLEEKNNLSDTQEAIIGNSSGTCLHNEL